MSAAEIRAIARAISGGGVDADSRAVGQTGATHVTSLAELERDIAAIAPRWTGEAAEKSYLQAGRFVRASSGLGLEFGRTLTQLTGLAGTAHTTNQRFSDLTDVSAAWGGRAGTKVGAAVASEFRSTYTAPVRADASTMPLGDEVAKVSFDFRPWERLENNNSGGATDEDGTSGGGGDGAGGGEAGGGSGDTTAETDPAGTVDTGGTETTADATDDAAGTDAASSQQTGTGTGAGAGTESGGGGAGVGADPSAGTGDDTASGDPAAYEPTADTEQPSSLLSPAATVPVGAGGRSPGGGLSGVRGGGAGQVASPLGLRQDTTVARSTPTPTGSGTTPTTGARPSGPYGMPAAGAGAQRGQGDGRHRLPAYLIDRRNGEELVGDLPLVGPGVIGQWKSDGAPDAPRAAPPPARTEPRPR